MRIIILGGPKRGKTSLARKLARELDLEHLCTDPQRLCPDDIRGTPDGLPYAGDDGVGQWVADHWIGNPSTLIEGVKAAHALLRYLERPSDRRRDNGPCDRLIMLWDALEDTQPRQEAQHQQVCDRLERLVSGGWALPRVESWMAGEPGHWVQER